MLHSPRTTLWHNMSTQYTQITHTGLQNHSTALPALLPPPQSPLAPYLSFRSLPNEVIQRQLRQRYHMSVWDLANGCRAY